MQAPPGIFPFFFFVRLAALFASPGELGWVCPCIAYGSAETLRSALGEDYWVVLPLPADCTIDALRQTSASHPFLVSY